MSSRIAETLLSGSHAARKTEPAARSPDDGAAFGPVFKHALSGGSRTPPARRAEHDEPTAVEVDDHDAEPDAGETAEAEAVTADAAHEAPPPPSREEDDEDAIEISSDAAAALAVAQLTKAAADADDAVSLDATAEPDGDVELLAPTAGNADEAPGGVLTQTKSRTLREFSEALPTEATAPSTKSTELVDAPSHIDIELAHGDGANVGERTPLSETADLTVDSVTKVAGADDSVADSLEDPEATTDEANDQRGAKNRSVTAETSLADDALTPTTASLGGGELPDQSSGREAPADTAGRSVDAAAAIPAPGAESPPERSVASNVRPASNHSYAAHASSGLDQDGDAGRARFVGRVEGAIRAAHARDGRIQVRLSPPELGALRIELNMQHGVMSARLETETVAARNLLLENLPALRDRLAQQDVRVDRFDVDVRRDGGGTPQQGTQDRPTADDGRRFSERRGADVGVTNKGGPSPPRRSGIHSDAALDVRI